MLWCFVLNPHQPHAHRSDAVQGLGSEAQVLGSEAAQGLVSEAAQVLGSEAAQVLGRVLGSEAADAIGRVLGSEAAEVMGAQNTDKIWLDVVSRLSCPRFASRQSRLVTRFQMLGGVTWDFFTRPQRSGPNLGPISGSTSRIEAVAGTSAWEQAWASGHKVPQTISSKQS